MSRARRNRGFALILALFLVVSLAAIAAYMMTVSTGQLAAVSQDEQAARAYQAARAGIDWAAYRILRGGVGYAAACEGAVQTDSLTLTTPGLAGFFVVVRCELVGGETEGGTNIRVFRLQSTGCNRSAGCPAPSDPTHVERQLELTLTTTS